MIKLIIFDKDGVILDLSSTWFPVLSAVAEYTISRLPASSTGRVTTNDLLASVGVDEASGKVDRTGVFARDLFAATYSVWQPLLPTSALDLRTDPDYQAKITELILHLVRGKSYPNGNIMVPLKNLHSAGFGLALLTNDNEVSAQQNLVDLNVDNMFSPVVGADSGYGMKPEPGGLLHCCSANGVEPAETIMVGDTITDYLVAKAAGAADFICIADDVALRPDPSVKPENVIPSLEKLPELLRRRGDTLLIKK